MIPDGGTRFSKWKEYPPDFMFSCSNNKGDTTTPKTTNSSGSGGGTTSGIWTSPVADAFGLKLSNVNGLQLSGAFVYESGGIIKIPFQNGNSVKNFKTWGYTASANGKNVSKVEITNTTVSSSTVSSDFDLTNNLTLTVTYDDSTTANYTLQAFETDVLEIKQLEVKDTTSQTLLNSATTPKFVLSTFDYTLNTTGKEVKFMGIVSLYFDMLNPKQEQYRIDGGVWQARPTSGPGIIEIALTKASTLVELRSKNNNNAPIYKFTINSTATFP